jgi:tRNA modification GTPase
MVEAHRPLDPDDQRIYEKINSKSIIMVMNKMDLVHTDSATRLPDDWHYEAQVRISALYDRGIDQLKERIIKLALGKTALDLNVAIAPNLRHKLLLETSLAAAEGVIEQLQNKTSSELVAINLQEAIDALGVISGDTAKVDVLDQIFSRFCVGK